MSSASRTWTDSNNNFYPDCDLANTSLQNLTATGGDICAAFTGSAATFGTAVKTLTNDHDTNFGFNHRGYNWEFSTELQQELVPRKIAVDLTFFRRWYGNFTATDNFAIAPSDYTAFAVVIPAVDPLTGQADLPLAGQTINGFLDVNADHASVVSDNHVRFASNYGKETETWQGFDLSTSIRLARGTQISGGVSSGVQKTDACDVESKVPEDGAPGPSLTGTPSAVAGPQAGPYCKQSSGWLTQVKGLATYTVPKVDVQLSGAFQIVPGLQESATLVVPCGAGTAVAASLGRACTAVGGKIIRFVGNRRVTTSVDLFNLFNGNTIQQATSTYPTGTGQQNWLVPTRIQQGRLLKFTVSANF